MGSPTRSTVSQSPRIADRCFITCRSDIPRSRVSTSCLRPESRIDDGRERRNVPWSPSEPLVVDPTAVVRRSSSTELDPGSRPSWTSYATGSADTCCGTNIEVG